MNCLVGPVDLGHGVQIEFFVYHNDTDVYPVGLVERHSRADNGKPCSGTIRFDTPEAHAAYSTPGAFWQVVSWEPLHVEPSLLCTCGNHGFIRGGRWIPA